MDIFEPVELEALGDEEIGSVRHCKLDADFNCLSDIADCALCRDRCVSQRTIQHNQSKGQLFRLKEG